MKWLLSMSLAMSSCTVDKDHIALPRLMPTCTCRTHPRTWRTHWYHQHWSPSAQTNHGSGNSWSPLGCHPHTGASALPSQQLSAGASRSGCSACRPRDTRCRKTCLLLRQRQAQARPALSHPAPGPQHCSTCHRPAGPQTVQDPLWHCFAIQQTRSTASIPTAAAGPSETSCTLQYTPSVTCTWRQFQKDQAQEKLASRAIRRSQNQEIHSCAQPRRPEPRYHTKC